MDSMKEILWETGIYVQLMGQPSGADSMAVASAILSSRVHWTTSSGRMKVSASSAFSLGE